MYSLTNALLRQWHRKLALPRQPTASWHRARLREELWERRTAENSLRKLSETSDVLFSISRAQHDGFPIRVRPKFASRYVLIYVYMITKYTLRWKFYQLTARLCDVPNYCEVREVVNPGKNHKLDEVAIRHNINAKEFKRVSHQLRRVWPLLP